MKKVASNWMPGLGVSSHLFENSLPFFQLTKSSGRSLQDLPPEIRPRNEHCRAMPSTLDCFCPLLPSLTGTLQCAHSAGSRCWSLGACCLAKSILADVHGDWTQKATACCPKPHSQLTRMLSLRPRAALAGELEEP